MEVLRQIGTLCASSPTHGISVCIVLKKNANDPHLDIVIHHACQSFPHSVPFMAILCHYVATSRGMRVEQLEDKLREAPMNRSQPFDHSDDHVDRMRQVLELVGQIPFEEYTFSFVVVEVPLELHRTLPADMVNPSGYAVHVQGIPGAGLVGLVNIANIIRERTTRPAEGEDLGLENMELDEELNV